VVSWVTEAPAQVPMIKQIFLRRLTVFAAAWCTVLAAGHVAAQTRELGGTGVLLDGIAAVVDDGVVLKSELEERLALVVAALRRQQAQMPPQQRLPLPPLSDIEEQVLEQLIVEQVQLQRAERLGIQVSDQVLNQALSQVAQSLGLTLEQMPSALEAEGIDYVAYREERRRELMLDQLEQREVLARISISPRELEQCLGRLESSQMNELDYNVSHILIDIPSGPDGIATARAQVEEIYERLENGEDFGQLALVYSDAETALEGGSLGWRKGSQLPTLFVDAILGMQAGEVSEPIQSASGFHIVRLNEVRGSERVMEDQVRARHILLTPNEIMDDDAVRQRLLGIRDQILAGDEFGPIARAVSQDVQSAADGGDLGWIGPGAVVPEFEEQLAALDVGELSEPFRSRFGWHLVEVVDRRSHDMTDELKQQQCVRQIRANKAEEERQLWLQRLRDQAFVDIRI
jgi:peptidyl-prolyl cis-trans isomerase SurA